MSESISAESYKLALESVSASLHCRLAHSESETWRSRCESAQSHLERAQSQERFYELTSAASCFVGQSKLFKEFGELTERERNIAIKAARYVLFNRTDT